MEILKELYYGNISEFSRRKSREVDKKEIELLDKIEKYLPEDQRKIIDELIDVIILGFDDDLADKYIQGFKTGILIGLEINSIKLN